MQTVQHGTNCDMLQEQALESDPAQCLCKQTFDTGWTLVQLPGTSCAGQLFRQSCEWLHAPNSNASMQPDVYMFRVAGAAAAAVLMLHSVLTASLPCTCPYTLSILLSCAAHLVMHHDAQFGGYLWWKV